ncbi:cobalt ECF transporter T component CbiQ [Neisseria sp. Ec49-e6-T10]|uniref:cobalt ECF transporter T component CbiQ n=1 Tax=Neisseria sp. Ec49-e6-T10 TaxID=3140744 RepID=UPI003EBCB6B2
MLEIDHLAYQNRWRTIDPLIKFGLFITLLLFVLWTTPMVQIVIFCILVPFTCFSARISLKRYGKWLLVPFSFLLVSMLGILLSVSWDGNHMWLKLTMGSVYIGIDAQSRVIAYETFWRSISALVVTFAFVLSTPFDQMIIIGKRCKVPLLLMEITLLTYRFIFIFLDEVGAIYRAQTLRFGYVSLRTSYHSLSMLVAMLLERVIDRYKKMSIALKMKLYDGHFHL